MNQTKGIIIVATETILWLLENGKWLYLSDITKKTQLTSGKVETVTKFLAKYDFITLDEAHKKVKLDLLTNKFFKEIRQLENEENSQQLQLCFVCFLFTHSCSQPFKTNGLTLNTLCPNVLLRLIPRSNRPRPAYICPLTIFLIDKCRR